MAARPTYPYTRFPITYVPPPYTPHPIPSSTQNPPPECNPPCGSPTESSVPPTHTSPPSEPSPSTQEPSPQEPSKTSETTQPVVAPTQPPVTNNPQSNNPWDPIQSNPNTPSATIASVPPTLTPDSGKGLPRGAMIGIMIVGLAMVGIITVFFIIRRTRHRRNQKPLKGDDFLSHLPVHGPTSPPLPPMAHAPNYPHHNSNHHQGGGQYDSMYHQGDHHHGGHDGQYQGFSDQGQGFSNQGQAHHGGGDGYDQLHQGHGYQGSGDSGYQGFSDTGHHGGGDGQFQGVSDQGTTQGGGGQTQIQLQGHGFDQGGANQLGGGTQGLQDPGLQGFSDQGPSNTFQTAPQPTSAPGGFNGSGNGGFQNGLPGSNQTGLPDNPFQNIGQGYPSGQHRAPQQLGGMSISGPVLPISSSHPLIGRPQTNSMARPFSSPQYSVAMPSSPGSIICSAGLSHVDETGQYLGYSPQSKQALLNSKIATIPSTQAHEVRGPQTRTEEVGAYPSPRMSNISPLNAYSRRHPQLHEGASAGDSMFYYDPSTNVRGPQDV